MTTIQMIMMYASLASYIGIWMMVVFSFVKYFKGGKGDDDLQE